MQHLLFVFSIEGIRIMDWDQLATVAQLITGVATLAVAVLLVSQLRQQHRDSEREILYTSQGRMQDLMRSIMTSDFGPIWTKGGQDFDSLDPIEKEQYRAFGYSMTTLQSVNACLLYTSPSPRDQRGSRMPSSA